MLLVVGTFIGIAVLVTAIYWIMFERSEVREQGELRKRLRGSVGKKAAKRIEFVKAVEKLSAVKPLEAALGRTAGITKPLQQQLARADMKLTVGGLLLASACLFFSGWVVIA